MTSSQAVSVTRSTSGVYIDAAGSYQTAAADTLRLTRRRGSDSAWSACRGSPHQQHTQLDDAGCCGRNSWHGPVDMVCRWSRERLTRTIVGSGTENGIDYIEVRWAGTASATSNILIRCNTLSHVVAAQGQTWTGSAFVKLQAGTLTGLSSVQLKTSSRSSGGTQLDATTTTITPTGAGLATQRSSATVTNADATTAFEALDILLNYTSGGVVDITLRIGWPQLEQGLWRHRRSRRQVRPPRARQTSSPCRFRVATQPGQLYDADLVHSTVADDICDEPEHGRRRRQQQRQPSDATPRRNDRTGQPRQHGRELRYSDAGRRRTGAEYRGQDVRRLDWKRLRSICKRAAVVTSAVGSLPSTIDRLTVGANGSGANFANGTIALVALWNDRLTNASLVAGDMTGASSRTFIMCSLSGAGRALLRLSHATGRSSCPIHQPPLL